MITPKYCIPAPSRYRCTCIRQYRRNFSSEGGSAPSEPLGLSERKDLILWQLRLSAYISGIAVSVYGGYVLFSSGFELERSRRKFLLHWNSLLYGSGLPPKVHAILNSRFSACLSSELLQSLSAYFIKFDLAKDNGFRRRDAILFLESVGIDVDNAFVQHFIASGTGESKDHRLVSGCSLQEFADLLEAIVLEDRMNGSGGLEGKLTEKLKEFTGEVGTNFGQPPRSFRLSNPLISGAATSLSKGLGKYIQKDLEEAMASDLRNELDRNYNLRAKLEAIAKTRKLSESEIRRLNAVHNEIKLLEDEVSKQNRTSNMLWWM